MIEGLRQRLRESGPLPVSDYMGHAVSVYYALRDPFGRKGDFTTAPEISQMFGELVGLWAAVVWQSLGSPERFVLAELGPGRGTLMRDALRAAAKLPGFVEAAEVHLVETSPALRKRQRKTLGDGVAGWHDSPEDLPDGPLILIANEFFDALPVRQYIRRGERWHERLVTLAGDGQSLAFVEEDAPAHSSLLPDGVRQTAAEGAIAEIRPEAGRIAAALGRRLADQGGAALVIDYGHATSAPGDTLQAVKDHAFHPVLDTPGEADITAHVDFQALAEAAGGSGAAVHGPLPQGTWLRRLGVEARAAALARAAPDQRETVEAALARLIQPDAMGTLFKVLALTTPGLPTPPGFEEQTRP